MRSLFINLFVSAAIALASCSGTARTLKPSPANGAFNSSLKPETIRVMTYNIHHCNPHLDAQRSPENRELQMKEITRYVDTEQLPFIIAGDFNATLGSSVITALDKYFIRTCQSCDPTIPEKNPIRAIDFIAFTPQSKFKVISSKVIDEQYVSDHRPVLAILKRQI